MRRVVEYDLLDIDPTMGVMTGRLIVGPSTLLNILGLGSVSVLTYHTPRLNEKTDSGKSHLQDLARWLRDRHET